MKSMLKKFLSILIVLSLVFISACGKKQVVVSEINSFAEDMNFDDLVREAIKESNGKTFVVKSALPRVDDTLDDFLEYLIKIDPEYDLDIQYEDMGDEDIVNVLNEEKKNKNSVAVVVGKNLNTFKELKLNPFSSLNSLLKRMLNRLNFTDVIGSIYKFFLWSSACKNKLNVLWLLKNYPVGNITV